MSKKIKYLKSVNCPICNCVIIVLPVPTLTAKYSRIVRVSDHIRTLHPDKANNSMPVNL